MYGALAEQLQPPNQTSERKPLLYLVAEAEDPPQVQAAEDTEFETLAVAEYERWMGSLAVTASGEVKREPAKINLLERTLAAKTGDPEAMASLNMNVSTAVSEAVLASPHITEIFMDRAPDDSLHQFGQANDDIYKNAVTLRPDRHQILQEITYAEGVNRHIIEKSLAAEKLKTHYFLAWSLVPDHVPEKDLGSEGDGYFLGDLKLSIQATTETQGGRVKTENAFMPGVEARDGDTLQERMARRHDFKALNKIRRGFGLRPLNTASEHLRGGFFVSKDKMPNGVADAMLWMDEAADEVLGRDIERLPEDYVAIRLESKRKEASLEGVKTKVVQDLFVAADYIDDPMALVQLMWDSIKYHAAYDSAGNTNIDPKAFGREAADNIERARQYLQNGDEEAAYDYIILALQSAEISGCGGGSARTKTAGSEGSEDLSYVAGSDERGSLAFRCPACGRINVRSHGMTMPTCWYTDCEADVDC